jgi:Cdc6-like AAA superfamily ATPase
MSAPTLDEIRYNRLPKAFNPSGPVTEYDMFKGRQSQIRSVLDAVFDHGRSIIIFGERGVGKTSLAKVIHDIIKSLGEQSSTQVVYSLVTCNRKASFSKLWHEIYKKVMITRPAKNVIGFNTDETAQTPDPQRISLGDATSAGNIDQDQILNTISETQSVWIFDEFNLVPEAEREAFADLIKALSDKNSRATVILVCVAEDVSEIIASHNSIERCTTQVLMPRMEASELGEILERAETITEMSFSPDSKQLILSLSQGFPYITHFLGREAAQAALSRHSLAINQLDIDTASRQFVDNAQESLKEAYRIATYSKAPNAIHEEVLLACALAQKDQYGNFTITSVANAISALRQRDVTAGVFAEHMAKFCEDAERGQPLARKGAKGSWVYKFANPLLQPYVLLRGKTSSRYSAAQLGLGNQNDESVETL